MVSEPLSISTAPSPGASWAGCQSILGARHHTVRPRHPQALRGYPGPSSPQTLPGNIPCVFRVQEQQQAGGRRMPMMHPPSSFHAQDQRRWCGSLPVRLPPCCRSRFSGSPSPAPLRAGRRVDQHPEPRGRDAGTIPECSIRRQVTGVVSATYQPTEQTSQDSTADKSRRGAELMKQTA